MCPSASYRQHPEMLKSSSSKIEYLTPSVPAAGADSKNGCVKVGLFGSSTIRAVLTLSSAILLFMSSSRYGSAPTLQELSDNVVSLTRQLDRLDVRGEAQRELHKIKHELDEKSIELAWAQQHISEDEEKHRLMLESFAKHQKAVGENFSDYEQNAKKVQQKAATVGYQLSEEMKENTEIRAALKLALDDLEDKRRKQGGEDGKLRGSLATSENRPFHPGDGIEIIEDQEGKTALFPGMVTNVYENTGSEPTYDLVKFYNGVMLKNMKGDQFRSYDAYPQGSQAFYDRTLEKSVPITILTYIGDRSGKHLVHGHYDVTRDDEANAELHMVPSTRVYRYLEY